jgi:glutathione synthase/RimK-type ligase-like ATP-grasp enzyme
MILVIGSSRDKVYPTLVRLLGEAGLWFRVIDEDDREPYRVVAEHGPTGVPVFRLYGGACSGRDPVATVFVRHAVARTIDPEVTGRLAALQSLLNGVLACATCPVVNPPANAWSNYSKVYQLGLLADAGFDVPRTVLTNSPEAARRFVDAMPGAAIYKGASNMMTLARVLTPERRERLAHLPNAPTVFQEFVPGADLRVHVIGDRCITTRLETADEDYRRAAFRETEEVRAAPFELPVALAELCVGITRALGLRVSGIDFKLTEAGRAVVLELNPFPQFTFYQRYSGQPIMEALVKCLATLNDGSTNILA